jgi:hypothetical protein
MKKFILAALAALLFAGATAPAQASAAPFLSMKAAKHKARIDLNQISDYGDYDMSCWRRSRNKVRCAVVFYTDDATCEATYQWYRSRYAGVLFDRSIRQPYCY